MMTAPPVGEERILEYTRSEFLFSRADTDAAVALREQLYRRRVETRPYVASRWFLPSSFRDGVIRINEPHVDEFLRANTHLVRGSERDLLVDSGLGLASLREELDELFERPVIAVATHRHFDHTGGLFEFDDVVVHRADADAVSKAEGFASVAIEDYPPEELSGYEPPERLLTALPKLDFDPAATRSARSRRRASSRRVMSSTSAIAGSRCSICPATPRGRSGCSTRRPASCSPAMPCTRAASSSTSSRVEHPELRPDDAAAARTRRRGDLRRPRRPVGRRRLHELVDAYLERRA